MHILVILGLFLPAYSDWKNRWIDDYLWSGLSPAYIVLLYGLYMKDYPYIAIVEGSLISLLVILFVVISRKIGAVFGGADFILLVLISPLSFIYSPPIEYTPYFFGLILFLLTMSILSIMYVVVKCVVRNRHNFKDIKSFSHFISLLYTYEVTEIDEDREILIKEDDDKKYVTPGIPIISFAFLTSLILFVYQLIL